MEYRSFGRTGRRVSAIGMGTYYDPLWILGSRLLKRQRGREMKLAALRRGLELGINLIDTAEIYDSENIVGDAIKGAEREGVFIATKAWVTHLRYDRLLRAAEDSLRRLGCSYIDLYQIHWPTSRVPIAETMKAMERLADEGKVRFIGVSNFSLPQLRGAEEALSRHRIASDQVEYNLLSRGIERDLLPYCEKNGIAIMAYRPIAHGALAATQKPSRASGSMSGMEYGGKPGRRSR